MVSCKIIKGILILFELGLLVSGSVIPAKEKNQSGTDIPIDISHFTNEAFGQPEEEVGEKLENFSPGTNNPEEVGTYYQGDILMPRSMLGRNGVAADVYRWKDGVIPYEIKGTFSK